MSALYRSARITPLSELSVIRPTPVRWTQCNGGSTQKGHFQMGTHARPRRRVRAAALGTLAVGATLTGVGLTAAALDQSGAGLADGTLSTEPVNFAASGLGAPVPVADVSSLDGSSA